MCAYCGGQNRKPPGLAANAKPGSERFGYSQQKMGQPQFGLALVRKWLQYCEPIFLSHNARCYDDVRFLDDDDDDFDGWRPYERQGGDDDYI